MSSNRAGAAGSSATLSTRESLSSERVRQALTANRNPSNTEAHSHRAIMKHLEPGEGKTLALSSIADRPGMQREGVPCHRRGRLTPAEELTAPSCCVENHSANPLPWSTRYEPPVWRLDSRVPWHTH